MAQKKIYIVDAVNYLFRSYYAIGPMTNPQGESTSALYGFIRSIQKLQKDFSPDYLCAVFDGPDNKQSRQEVYADYKMHRKGAPEDLYPQFSHAFSWCEMAGIPAISVRGVEADDTMGTIAVWAEKKGMEVYLCTTDKDLYQLVGKNIFVLNAHKDNMIIDAKKVKELFGVTPEQMLDFLSITGDKSDNIPGLPGFGPKTAAELLQKKETLEEILAHPEILKGKKQEILKKESDKAILSKKLATLDLKIDVPKKLDFYEIKEPDFEALRDFYHEMKFMKLLQDLKPSLGKEEEEEEKPKKIKKEKKEKTTYHLIKTEEELDALIDRLKKAQEICIDTETTSLHPMEAKIVGIGFGLHPKEAWYVPFNGELEEEIIIEALEELFSSKKIGFYGHNLKFDYHALSNHELTIEHICFDTILASYLLNPQNRHHGLDRLALEYFNHKKIPIESLSSSKKKKDLAMEKVPLEKISEYCCEDVDYSVRLKDVFEKELKKRKLDKVLYDIELPLIPVLAKMERHGMYIDVKKFESLSKEFSHELKKREKEIYKEAGVEFNINSPKQLSHVLYKDLGLTPPRKRTTEFSTAADVLEKLAHESPVVEKILAYRTIQKLFSTYIETLPKQICKETGRIHATFMQSITATGRLSCQDPNLQNIPVRGKEGKKIREGFKPEKRGWNYLSFDYSQIELRLLAHFSEDPELIRAFKKGEDIHAYTASLVYDVPLKEVTPKMRHTAKAVNFGIIYGQGPYGLAQQTGLSTRKAAEFIETYFERYKKVSHFLEHCKSYAEKNESAKTLIGRQRPIPEIHNKNPQIRAAAQRLAINTPLQGTAADLIKLSMIEIDKETEKHKLEGFMILQIHDELIFEVPDSEIATFKKIVTEQMEGVIKLKVPLVVDIAVGKNWAEC